MSHVLYYSSPSDPLIHAPGPSRNRILSVLLGLTFSLFPFPSLQKTLVIPLITIARQIIPSLVNTSFCERWLLVILSVMFLCQQPMPHHRDKRKPEQHPRSKYFQIREGSNRKRKWREIISRERKARGPNKGCYRKNKVLHFPKLVYLMFTH